MRADSHTWLIVAREAAWTRQNGRCAYCRKPLRRSEVTADHRVARAHGGVDRDNIKAACRPCNRAKGHMDERIFLKLVRAKRRLPPGIDLDVQVQRAVYHIHAQAEQAIARIRRFAR